MMACESRTGTGDSSTGNAPRNWSRKYRPAFVCELTCESTTIVSSRSERKVVSLAFLVDFRADLRRLFGVEWRRSDGREHMFRRPQGVLPRRSTWSQWHVDQHEVVLVVDVFALKKSSRNE